jgi:nucleoside-diphosphate-sugar epimerase
VKPKTLLHLAGTRGRDPSADCAILNFYGTTRLLELAQTNRVQRIVIVGSAEEYGNQAGPLNEQLPLRPCTEYGISKALATRHALALYAREECPVVVVRPFSIYGPCQPGEMFVAQAVEAAVRDVPFKMSLGKQKRDLVFVEDVVSGLVGAAVAPQVEGKVINLGTGRPYRLRDVAARIWEMTGSHAPLVIGDLQPPPEELGDTWADTRRAHELLHWEPEVDLDEGLRQTISFARQRYGDKVQLCQTA